MEQLPKVIKTSRQDMNIPIDSYIHDHKYNNSIVLPGVTALQKLAQSTQEHIPALNVRHFYNIAFERFLFINDDEKEIHALNEIIEYNNGMVSSSLITEIITKIGIKRQKKHVISYFNKNISNSELGITDNLHSIKSNGFQIPINRIYQDLIQFGNSFHNITDKVYISDLGSVAVVKSPSVSFEIGQLGSPFPLDAAFQCANIWGQRYCNIIGFPVALKERIIHIPTSQNIKYICMIMPIDATHDTMRFDIRITDNKNILHEEIKGLLLRDISAGKTKPPQWIKYNGTL